MPSTRDIRRRIKSVKNTAQITKAMQMVAASKMRKAQQAALSGRPCATLMNHVLGEVAGSNGDFNDPLMEKRQLKKRAVIVVSSDKGLCGGLNGNLMREAAKFDRRHDRVSLRRGAKGSQFIARTKRATGRGVHLQGRAGVCGSAGDFKICAVICSLSGKVDQVDILYTKFISTLNQKPEIVPFLPVGEVKGVGKTVHDNEKLTKGTTEFLFEPDVQQVMEALLPHYLNYRVYQILLEAKASEQSSRMVAMKNATDNAKQIIKDLTLEYNKLRQANITKELLEITSAAMAMS